MYLKKKVKLGMFIVYHNDACKSASSALLVL